MAEEKAADAVENDDAASTETTTEVETDEKTTEEAETEEKSDSEETTTEDEAINVDDFEIEERDIEVADKKPKEDSDDTAEVGDERLSKIEQVIQKQRDEIEINSYLQDNPEYSKYKQVIMKYVAHPAYRNIPVRDVAAIVSAKDQQRIGASKERQAAARAKSTHTGGQQRTQTNSKPVDYSKLSPTEMEAVIAKVKGQV